MSQYGKKDLIDRLSDYIRKGWTNQQVKDLIDSLWRDPYSLRTSGFDIPGGTDAILSFQNGSRKLKLSPLNKKFTFYQRVKEILSLHKKYVEEEIELTSYEGLHFVYYTLDEDTKQQMLTEIVNPTEDEEHDLYLEKCLVAVIYWNNVGLKAEYFGDERHGSEWNPQINWWAQRAFNGIREEGLRINGLTIGDGSLPAHAQFGVSGGTYYHEDIKVTIESVTAGDTIPQFYRSFTNVRWDAIGDFAIHGDPDVAPYINYLFSLSEVPEAYFFFCHVFATNCKLHRVITVMGYWSYETEYDAVVGLDWELDFLKTWLPHRSVCYIQTILWEKKDKFTTGCKARIVGQMDDATKGEIIANEKVPFKKNGWDPLVQDQTLLVWDNATRKLTIEIDNYTQYYSQNTRFKLTEPQEIVFNDALGMQYATYDRDSLLISTEKWDDYQNTVACIFAIYYNNRQQKAIFTGWYFFMWEMEADTRGNQIKETGMEKVAGLEVSICEDAGHTHEVNVSEGSIRLADILADIQDLDGPNQSGDFDMHMSTLVARRHYLLTYAIPHPDAPAIIIVTQEWEYQEDNPNYIVVLSDQNEVCINELNEDDQWVLTSTSDGEYSAMWLIACLDFEQPLKWICGGKKSSNLEDAKILNDEESLVTIIEAQQFFTDHYVVIARAIVKNIAAEPYYELIEIKNYGDDEFTDTLNFKVWTDMSVTGEGTETHPVILVNDEDEPGTLMYYGTDEYGIKGYHRLELPPDEGSGSGSGEETTVDEKVKYDASDPVSGYLSEKIVAGENIVVEEGTGSDENKVKISAVIPSFNGQTFDITGGFHYNWWAAADFRNMAPVGWKVPSEADLIALRNYLDSTATYDDNDAGDKLKETGLSYWDNPNTGTNESLFYARGSGTRIESGFTGKKASWKIWSTGERDSVTAYVGFMQHDETPFYVEGWYSSKFYGCSVRLLCESSTDPGFMIGNNGVSYPTVKIGNQVWTACNVVETKYRNGDLIAGPIFTNAAWTALTSAAYCIYEDDILNAYENETIIHNLLSGLQGGSDTERYHHTKQEIDDHVYEAPSDNKSYIRKNTEWVEDEGTAQIQSDWNQTNNAALDFIKNKPDIVSFVPFEKDFEFCVIAGTPQTFKIDRSASFAYTITKVKLESDGTLEGVQVKIGSTAVTGLNDMDISTMQSFTATAANVVAENDVITIVTTATYSGTPTVLAGKIIFEV